MKSIIIKTLSVIILLSTLPLYAQIQEGESLNGVAAIVGKQVITKAEVQAEMMTYQQQMGQSMLVDNQELHDRVLENLINQNLMITKALEDSITVSDDEIEEAWNNALSNLVRRYGSESRVEDVYGKSLNRLKFEYTDQIRKNLLVQKLQQQKFGNVKATPKEVEEFYNEYKDSLETTPEKVEVYHIVKNVSSDKGEKSEIYELARRVRDSILKDQLTFEEAAERYSADAATKSDGGNLGWFEKGKLVPEFEKAAFNLQQNELSLPIETPFGYHIIQTLDKKENSVNTRHIVFSIKTSEKDDQKTKDFLSELKQRVKDGESFEKLAKQYSDDKETKGYGGLIGKLNADEIPESMKEILNKLDEGEISNPIKYKADPTKTAYHIIYKKRMIEAHIPTLKEDYDLIQRYASSKKRQELMQEYFDNLRSELYWEKF